MVRLLIQPIRRIRWLLIPCGCTAGFITNIAITSQTAAAAAVGPILVPLMLGAGFSPALAGSTLLLGCSGGGSLLNPSDADLVAIQRFSDLPMTRVWNRMAGPLLAAFLSSTFALMLISRKTIPSMSKIDSPGESRASVELLKALLPPLPVILIFATLPNFGLFPELLTIYPHGLPVPHAMLICTVLLLLLYGKDLSSQTKTFFEGMGFAYVNVISLIMTAACFIAGMKAVGLTARLVGWVSGGTWWSLIASAGFPWMLAVLCGSGIAPTIAFAQAVLPSLAKSDPDLALQLGTAAAIASSLGRTMSPVAAVVIFTSSLVQVSPTTLAKQIAPVAGVGILAALLSLAFLR